MRKVKLTKESTKDILETLLKRSPNNYGKYEDAVADILAKVKAEGDEALFAFTREFDKVEVTKETIRVTPEEIEEAYKLVDPSLIDVIKKALVNIRSYQEQLVHKYDRRYYAWPESNCTEPCRCLCSRRKSCISIFCTDEYRSCQSSRCGPYCNDNPSGKRRKGESKHTGCCQ